MFFKIESWNFQHLFKIKFRETSWNFNSFSSFSSFRQLLFFVHLSVVWLSWNFGSEVSGKAFSNRCWKCQLTILKNKKVLFFSKVFFKQLSISKQKRFFYWPKFQWRFWAQVLGLSNDATDTGTEVVLEDRDLSLFGKLLINKPHICFDF